MNQESDSNNSHEITNILSNVSKKIVESIGNAESISGIEDKYHELLIEPVNLEDIGKERKLNTLIGAIATIITLQKKDEIKTQTSPFNYTAQYISKVLEYIVRNSSLDGEEKRQIKEDKESIKSKLRKNFERENWNKLQYNIKPVVNVLHWENLGGYPRETKDSMVGISGTLQNLNYPNEEWFAIKPEGYRGDYHDYFRYLDSRLRDVKDAPDIALVDSIRLSDYEAKGLFRKIEDRRLFNEIENLGKERNLAKTINHRFVAVPITRNFHLPASGGLSNAEKKVRNLIHEEIKSEEGFLENLLKVDFSGAEEYIGDCIRKKWEEPPNEEGQSRRLPFTNYVLGDNCSGKFINRMMTGIPFIPMQLASGPHTAYTFFSYMSGIPNNSTGKDNIKSLIDVKEQDGYVVRMYDKAGGSDRLEVERAASFLKTIYLYTPFISLCLDQERAGEVRQDMQNLWFDPCLPIEARHFQEAPPDFADEPLRAEDNPEARLSCLGGFCLAVTQSSDEKEAAFEVALQIAREYFEGAQGSPSLTRISYTRDMNEGNSFRKTPVNIAQRPNFIGWPLMESIISRTVRLYVTSIMVYRSIHAEAVLISENSSTESREKVSELLAKVYNIEDRDDEITLKVGKDRRVLDVYFRKKGREPVLEVSHIESFIKNCRKEINKYFQNIDRNNEVKWLNANISPLEYEASSIYGILRSALEKGEQKRSHNEVINNIAKEMMDKLQSQIEELCESEGWEYRGIDNEINRRSTLL